MVINVFISILEYLFVLFVILDTNTVYAYSITKDYHVPETAAIILFILVLIKLATGNIKLATMQKILFFFIIYYPAMFVLFTRSVSDSRMLSFVARFFIILPLLTLLFCIYVQEGNIYYLFYRYTNIMTVLAVISLHFWVWGSQLHFVEPTGLLPSHWGYDYIYPSYYGLYFERQRTSFLWYSGLRNDGIFCEAPMYSLCLIIAIAIIMFIPKESIDKERSVIKIGKRSILTNDNNKIKLTILIITLLTTITTTGQILLILMLAARFVLTNPKSKWARIFKIFAGFGAVVAGFMLAYNIFMMKSTSHSWSVRQDDFQAGFKAWQSSPIFGLGFNDVSVIYPFMSLFRFNSTNNPGFSNSIMQILAQGGAILFLTYFIPVLGSLFILFKRKEINIIVFIGVFILEFIFTLFSYQFLMLFLLAFLYGLIITQAENNTYDSIYLKGQIPEREKI